VNFEIIEKSSDAVKSAVNQVINKVNSDLAPFPVCAKLKLKEIRGARKSKSDFLVTFNVYPSSAILEATIRCNEENCEDYEIIGTVSRLNSYGDQSRCVNSSHLRKYCYCID
jgi:hypothetical protein